MLMISTRWARISLKRRFICITWDHLMVLCPFSVVFGNYCFLHFIFTFYWITSYVNLPCTVTYYVYPRWTPFLLHFVFLLSVIYLRCCNYSHLWVVFSSNVVFCLINWYVALEFPFLWFTVWIFIALSDICRMLSYFFSLSVLHWE